MGLRPSTRPNGRFFIDNELFENIGRLMRPIHFAVYAVLAKHTSFESQECYPGEETIAKCIASSRNTVSKAVNDLESWGYIYIKRTKGSVNHYWMLDISTNPPKNSAGTRTEMMQGSIENDAPTSPEMMQEQTNITNKRIMALDSLKKGVEEVLGRVNHVKMDKDQSDGNKA